MERPSKKQHELLMFIDGFVKGNGYGPSYREIMRALDYKSVSTVATHVNGLIARGWLVKKDNSARSLEVVSAGNRGNIVRSDKSDKSPVIAAIETKIDELAQDPDRGDDIEVLQKALLILEPQSFESK